MQLLVYAVTLLAFLFSALPAFAQAGPQGLYFPGPSGISGGSEAFTNLRVGPGSVSITGGSLNGTDRISNMCINGVCPVTAWGVTGNAQQRFDCTMGGLTVTCPDAVFNPNIDVGKTAVFWNAGTPNPGGTNNTVIGTIVGVISATQVNLSVPGTMAANGIFAWGTDDTANIQRACAQIGPSLLLSFPPANYLMTSQLTIGNNSPTQCEQLYADNATLIFAIPNHTVSGVIIAPPRVAGQGYLPVLIRGYLNVDMMNTGFEGVQIAQGQPIRVDNLTISRSYRNGLSHIVTGQNWIQQEAFTHLLVRMAGLHSIYYWSNAPSGWGFIDNIDYRNLDLECQSLNGMQLVGTPVTGALNNVTSGDVRLTVGSTAGYTSGLGCTVLGVQGTTEANGQHYPCAVIDATHLDLLDTPFANAYTGGGRVAPSSQLGALIAALSTTGSNGLLFQHSYGFQAELNSCRGALLAGQLGPPANATDISTDAVQFLDGTRNHVIEGPGNPSAVLGAIEKWLFNSPIVEDNSGGAQSIGAEFAAETNQMIIAGLVVTNHQFGGAYSVPDVFIPFTPDCTAGCGNEIALIGQAGDVATKQYGGFTLLGKTTVAGLGVCQPVYDPGMVEVVDNSVACVGGAVPAGGGNTHCFVHCDGTAWRIF